MRTAGVSPSIGAWRAPRSPCAIDGRVRRHVDVDANHPSRGDADAGFGPVAPDVDLVVGGVALAVPAPLGVLVPGAKLVDPASWC
jgi:hypothetical protein